jgi:hypothetical protein
MPCASQILGLSRMHTRINRLITTLKLAFVPYMLCAFNCKPQRQAKCVWKTKVCLQTASPAASLQLTVKYIIAKLFDLPSKHVPDQLWIKYLVDLVSDERPRVQNSFRLFESAPPDHGSRVLICTRNGTGPDQDPDPAGSGTGNWVQ